MQSFKRMAKRLGKTLAGDSQTVEPRLRWGLEFYLLAFLDLDNERNHGMGWERIPWTSLINYAEHYRLNDDETERFVMILNELDLAHIGKMEEKRKEKEEKERTPRK